ncbi:MAG TPA: sulfate ABC transporter permease subunit CysT [Caulobacteraceae bacterium]|jgi:sulfate transport system permease protein|nr:sulfate ABC transporter permease subunit CysT [Caulobacteraceae bacterium]
MVALAPTAGPPSAPWREPSALPGFSLAFGFTLFYLGLMVVLPLAALAAKPWEHGVAGFFEVVTAPRTLAALRLSFLAAAAAAAANVALGLLTAWVLSRYDFPGRRIADALVDLPFALPTAVAGIALAALYGPNGWIGEALAHLGVKVAYTPLGVFVALLAVGLPFVVRTLQPVLEDLDAAWEEAAVTLGAGRWTIFARIIAPVLAPALIAGFALAFARGAGEYGSVIFIAGNMPMVSEIAPLVIVTKLEGYDYAGAAAVGVAMVVISMVALAVTNGAQIALARRTRR